MALVINTDPSNYCSNNRHVRSSILDSESEFVSGEDNEAAGCWVYHTITLLRPEVLELLYLVCMESYQLKLILYAESVTDQVT